MTNEGEGFYGLKKITCIFKHIFMCCEKQQNLFSPSNFLIIKNVVYSAHTCIIRIHLRGKTCSFELSTFFRVPRANTPIFWVKPYPLRNEMKCSGKTEILYELVHDTMRISSLVISVSPLHFISFLTMLEKSTDFLLYYVSAII